MRFPSVHLLKGAEVLLRAWDNGNISAFVFAPFNMAIMQCISKHYSGDCYLRVDELHINYAC